MESRQDQHANLIAAHRRTLAEAARILLVQDSWSLEAPMLLIEEDPGDTRARQGAVGQLSSWLEHLDPELDAFVHLRQAGVDFEPAREQCLREQGDAFEAAWARALAGNPLVTHDNLAGFTALSQKGFGRSPRELLVVVRWSDRVTACLVACEPLI
ncbi:MAG: hypothetical protein NTZ53_13575 [Cyanobacteria bacterium]|nr:hypothetical protein [Cyanobacteriota bacterium]